MEQNVEVIQQQLQLLHKKIEEMHQRGESTHALLGELLMRIYSEYPGDVGCFWIYFLNYIQLEPYESIFLAPNVPHSYLSGDIVECMACSDNVVRAGLTPKLKDVGTLVNMLDYTPGTVGDNMFRPATSGYVTTFNPPVDDFSVKMIKLPRGELSEFVVDAVNGPSILLVVCGEAVAHVGDKNNSLSLRRGTVCFVACGCAVTLTEISSESDVVIFQAYCQLT